MDIFQEVKERVSTIDAAQQYGLILHRKGNTHWSLCPFHQDKRPSLAIFQDDGFKCFSCGTGGADSITFTARLFKLSMIDAAKKMVTDFSIPGFDQDAIDVTRREPEELSYSDFITGLKEWDRKTFNELCGIYKLTGKLLSIWDLEEELFSELVTIHTDADTWTDILIYGDMMDRFNLYKHLKNIGWG